MILRNYRQHYRIENLRKIIEKLSLSKKIHLSPTPIWMPSESYSGSCCFRIFLSFRLSFFISLSYFILVHLISLECFCECLTLGANCPHHFLGVKLSVFNSCCQIVLPSILVSNYPCLTPVMSDKNISATPLNYLWISLWRLADQSKSKLTF